jgi:hypothetical protein
VGKEVKEVTVFSNSSGYFVKDGSPDGSFKESYVARLMEDYLVTGFWRPGLSVLDYRRMIGEWAKRYTPIIVHVGCTDAITRPPEVFVAIGLDYILNHGYDEYVSPLIPEMRKAIQNVVEEKPQYRRLVEPDRFRDLYSSSCRFFVPWQAIFMGLVNPVTEKDYLRHQLEEYNGIIKEVAAEYKQHFVDVWNIAAGHSRDTTHLSPEGHVKVYAEVRRILNG